MNDDTAKKLKDIADRLKASLLTREQFDALSDEDRDKLFQYLDQLECLMAQMDQCIK